MQCQKESLLLGHQQRFICCMAGLSDFECNSDFLPQPTPYHRMPCSISRCCVVQIVQQVHAAESAGNDALVQQLLHSRSMRREPWWWGTLCMSAVDALGSRHTLHHISGVADVPLLILPRCMAITVLSCLPSHTKCQQLVHANCMALLTCSVYCVSS